MKRNEQAWAILREDEKLALTLKHGHAKSTWEAGEIMEKAHYKFLEIEARARHFMKLFTEHFETFSTLIPRNVVVEPRVAKYFHLVIEQRLMVTEAAAEIGDTIFLMPSFRDRLIGDEIARLMKVEKVSHRHFANLVREFDRWNNHRILPRDIQEPSAFKRRNKKNDIKNIRNLWDLHPLILDLFRRRYSQKGGTGRFMYIPLPSMETEPEKCIFVTNFSEKILPDLNRLGLYAFSRKVFAEEFLKLIIQYKVTGIKNPKEGLKFWPNFRVACKNSLNYDQIQKKVASRKFLEMALKDLDKKIAGPDKNNETDY